eukprot:1170194-Prymnesium_polylepis.1
MTEPVAHRQSSEYPTTLRAAGCMGWPLDASRGLPQEQQVAYHDTKGLGCGRGRHRFDVRCTLITRSPCRRALRGPAVQHQPTSEAHNASGWPNWVSCRVTLLVSWLQRVVLLQLRFSAV